MNPQREGIHWLRYPEAEVFVNDHLSQFVGRVAPVQALQADLMAHTGTRLVDWLDHPVLAEWGVEMMRPFSDFPHLRQAFTRGERWDVPAERLERLVAAGHIDGAQRGQFASEGAVGSHLENIQRGEGFKGFNQRTVSDIIRRTDPRAEFQAP